MEDILKKAVGNELLKKPSVDFTDKVMNEIFEMKVAADAKPLISLRAWVSLAIGLAAFIAFIIAVNPASSGKFEFLAFQKLGIFLSAVKWPSFSVDSNINILVFVGASLAMALLIGIDFLLFRNVRQRK